MIQPDTAPIPALLEWSRPAAIVLAVAVDQDIVVDAVDAHPVRSNAHVRQEVLKRDPPFANSDAATAVVGEVWRIRIPTSFQHMRPCSIRRRAFATRIVAVSKCTASLHG